MEFLPALDRYECPELDQQQLSAATTCQEAPQNEMCCNPLPACCNVPPRFSSISEYVRNCWAKTTALEANFWHLLAMVFLMLGNTKDLEELQLVDSVDWYDTDHFPNHGAMV